MNGYSAKAQPYLDVIARGVFTDQAVRDWLVRGTFADRDYRGATALAEEQKAIRWRSRPTKQPFWANYWCGKDTRCTCRIAGSRGLETDAIFFLQSPIGRVMAVHVEFKHRGEPFQHGQPEAYPLRAACFAKTYAQRRTVNPHDDWLTVIFCGEETLADPRLSHFQRTITHAEAAKVLEGYPQAGRP